MRHDGTDGGGDSARADGDAAALDDPSLDVPNCPGCLHRMEVAETRAGGVHWACPVCGRRKLA